MADRQFAPCEEHVQAFGDKFCFRWMARSDKLIITERLTGQDGSPVNRYTTLIGEDVRKHPQLVRVLAQVVRLWQSMLPPEEAGTLVEAEDITTEVTETEGRE